MMADEQRNEEYNRLAREADVLKGIQSLMLEANKALAGLNPTGAEASWVQNTLEDNWARAMAIEGMIFVRQSNMMMLRQAIEQSQPQEGPSEEAVGEIVPEAPVLEDPIIEVDDI